MAPKLTAILIVAFSFLFQQTLAEVICEELPTDLCAFAIASSGKRCVLENTVNGGGESEFTCETSPVVVESLPGYIETDQCVAACGADRNFVGISSDAFLSPSFTSSLCADECFQNCPNIVDLYVDLAAAEGVNLPDLCRMQKENPHRSMLAVLSSNGAAGLDASSPASAPVTSQPGY
ncbi:hypothetical protein M569_03929 [Genlisea aurea]|uniref:PAR1 protein n=1 Tax=Genlisea aurea TaxID=192259 RepID=S8EE91_9LAMI|nr:hypothetical protein M569_03929 [Genlisea aurea]